MKRSHKIHILILSLLVVLATIFVVSNLLADRGNLKKQVNFAVSFDPAYAFYLGLDPKSTYLSLFNNLGTKSVRLSAHWDSIEPEQDKYNFLELDWYISEAEKNQAKVILAIGHKLPRWPECRQPGWLEIRNYLRERQLVMLKAVIKHYDNNPAVWAWQLENEPLLQFGICPKPDRNFLQKEVEFVRSLTQKPIIITDSGELRPWITPAKLSDILGITLYRTVETPWFGTFHYPLPAFFYQFKSKLVSIFAPQNQKIIIVELQAEPWVTSPLTQTPLLDQVKKFSLDQFKQNVMFARKTGFSEIYLWGAEWWYYMAQNGHPEYLQYARSLF